MNNILKLMRPYQYVKNIFIFAPLLFSFNFDDNAKIVTTLIIFILFSLLASSVYVLNDLMDIQEDKAHPTKKNRPLANGSVSIGVAKFLFVFLSAISLIGSFFISIELFYVLVAYFILNISYSLKLKHISIVDIFIIATGFVLRLFAGSVATDIHLSMWIIIITFLLAIFLALAKRRDDVLLSMSGAQTRKNIDGYNLEFVNAAMTLMSGVVVVSYILYTVSSEVIARVHTEYLFLTSFFVLLGIFRYMQITFVEQKSGSPSKIVLSDLFLQITLVLWVISFIVIVKMA